jgi:16S rRNA (guanine527-N7)-methyltransferase
MDQILCETLIQAAHKIQVSLTARETALFGTYCDELVFWNRKMNLVGAKSHRDVVIKHFIDSLTPVPFLDNPSARLLDMGSGGGFPGIPLKIAVPSLQIALLEASRKKASFLKHMIRCLGFSQAQVIHARAEVALRNASLCNAFDTVISRAAFKLQELLETAYFFLAPQGRLIAMKGPNFREEADTANNPNLVFEACHSITVPFSQGKRNILIYRKDI